MLLASVILSVLTALGTLAIALKYIFGPAPADYHREMITAQGEDISDIVAKVTWALNKAFGFSLIGIALCFAGLAIFGVFNGLLWAKVLLVIVVITVSLPLTVVAFKMEKLTGVKAPWRPAAFMLVLGLTAFVLSIV